MSSCASRRHMLVTVLTVLALLLIACGTAKSLASTVSASWQKVTYGGLTMYAPRNWPTVREQTWGDCGTAKQPLFRASAVVLNSGAHPAVAVFHCPAITTDSAIPPEYGLVVDPGQSGPLPVTGFDACLLINGLSVCPTSTSYGGILVLAVHLPGIEQPVAVEIGLGGGGRVAHTILYSMRASPPTPTTTTTVPEQEPWPSLVYEGPGVALVGISPGNGYEGTAPSHLYLSTDMVHWRDVTPPQSRVEHNGGFGWFEHASFINVTAGWVTAWMGPANTDVTIYRTSDGGKTWSAVSGGNVNIGDTLIQLLTPTVAYLEALEPTAPGMSLEVTTDAGENWRTVYTGPPPGELSGPFEVPIVFVDPRHAFGTGADIALESWTTGVADFFYSSDGGSTWTRESPPLPSGSLACPTDAGMAVGFTPSTVCLFVSPRFSDPEHGVLPGIVVLGTTAHVAFDVTQDGGLNWSLQSQRPVNVPKGSAAAGFNYPLVSVASPTSWWLVGWTSTGVTVRVTGDAGARWTENTDPVDGTPIQIAALNASTAVLNVQDEGTGGAAGEVLVTTDGGRTWKPVVFGN